MPCGLLPRAFEPEGHRGLACARRPRRIRAGRGLRV